MTIQDYCPQNPLVVLTQRAVMCLWPLTPHRRLETSQRIAYATHASVPTGGCFRPLAEVITHQQSRNALSDLSPVSSPVSSPPTLNSHLYPFFPSRHSTNQPTGVPQLALLLSWPQGWSEFSEGTSSKWIFDVEIETLRTEIFFNISRRPKSCLVSLRHY
jgi:hypothetical protein